MGKDTEIGDTSRPFPAIRSPRSLSKARAMLTSPTSRLSATRVLVWPCRLHGDDSRFPRVGNDRHRGPFMQHHPNAIRARRAHRSSPAQQYPPQSSFLDGHTSAQRRTCAPDRGSALPTSSRALPQIQHVRSARSDGQLLDRTQARSFRQRLRHHLGAPRSTSSRVSSSTRGTVWLS